MGEKKFNHRLWQQYIRKARQYYTRYEANRFKVAQFAIDACDLSHGGRKDGRFTLTSFARELSLNPKTLFQWVRIKRRVVDRLPKNAGADKVPFKALCALDARISEKSTSSEIKIFFAEETKRDPNYYKWKSYLKHLSAISTNFKKPILLQEIPIECLEKVSFYIGAIRVGLDMEINARKNGGSWAKTLATGAVSRRDKAMRGAKTQINSAKLEG